jgi:aldehyde oxidoreductase
VQNKLLVVNGLKKTVIAEPEANLGDVIRGQLGLTGTKVSCDTGHCGACSVLINGKLTLSCITKLKKVPEGADITTVEGVGTPEQMHPIQEAIAAYGGAQCGFCTPGFVVSAKALLDSDPDPDRDAVRQWFTRHHNACRCTGYKPIVDAEAAPVRDAR